MVLCIHPSESDEFLPARSSLRGMVGQQASRLAQKFSSLKTAYSYTLSSQSSTMTNFSVESFSEKPQSPSPKANSSTKLKVNDSLAFKNVQASCSSDTAFRRAQLVNADASALISRPRAISLTQSQINTIKRINHPNISEGIKLHPPLTDIPSLFQDFTSTTEMRGGVEVSGRSSKLTTPALRSTDFPEELIQELQAESQRRLAETLTSTMGFHSERTSTAGHSGDRARDRSSEKAGKNRCRGTDGKKGKKSRRGLDLHEKPSAPQMTVLTSIHDLDKYFSKHPDVQLELKESELFDIPRREVTGDLYLPAFSLPLLTASDPSLFHLMQQMHQTASRTQLPAAGKGHLDDKHKNTGSLNEEAKDMEETNDGNNNTQVLDSLSQVSHQLHQWCHSEERNVTSREKSWQLGFVAESHFDGNSALSLDVVEPPCTTSDEPGAVCTCAELIICECDAKDLLEATGQAHDPSVSRLALLETTISHCRGLTGQDRVNSSIRASPQPEKVLQEDSSQLDLVVSPSSSTTSTGSWRKHSTRPLKAHTSPPPIY